MVCLRGFLVFFLQSFVILQNNICKFETNMHKSINTPQNNGDKAISRVTTLPAMFNKEIKRKTFMI